MLGQHHPGIGERILPAGPQSVVQQTTPFPAECPTLIAGSGSLHKGAGGHACP